MRGISPRVSKGSFSGEPSLTVGLVPAFFLIDLSCRTISYYFHYDLIDLSCRTILLTRTKKQLRTIRFYIIGLIIFCCLMIAACTGKTVPVGPKFSGRVLFQTGNNTNGSDLIELTAGPDSTYKRSTIVSGVFEAAASPDRTRLLYTTKDGILLRDLRTGDVKPLVKGEANCLTWSPDGKRFSYKQKSAANEKASLSGAVARTKLYVSDLDGKA